MKPLPAYGLAYGLLLTLAACHATPDAPAAPPGTPSAPAPAVTYHTVPDDLGRPVRLPLHPRRVVALAPSMTEMLWAVAAPAQLVGRTPNCNYPAAALALPVVNTYPLDVEALVRLRPDAVFTVEGMTSADHVARLEKLGIPVYQQAYDSVRDIPRALADLGRLLGRPAKGRHVADSLRRVLAALRTTPAAPAARPAPPTVLAVTWTDPIYAYGHRTLFSDVLRYAGAVNAVPATIPQPYPVVPRETVLHLNPAIVLGNTFEGFDTTLFRRYPELRQVNAYRHRRVFAVDDDLLARPSPRIGLLVAAVQQLVAAVPAPSAAVPAVRGPGRAPRR